MSKVPLPPRRNHFSSADCAACRLHITPLTDGLRDPGEAGSSLPGWTRGGPASRPRLATWRRDFLTHGELSRRLAELPSSVQADPAERSGLRAPSCVPGPSVSPSRGSATGQAPCFQAGDLGVRGRGAEGTSGGWKSPFAGGTASREKGPPRGNAKLRGPRTELLEPERGRLLQVTVPALPVPFAEPSRDSRAHASTHAPPPACAHTCTLTLTSLLVSCENRRSRQQAAFVQCGNAPFLPLTPSSGISAEGDRLAGGCRGGWRAGCSQGPGAWGGTPPGVRRPVFRGAGGFPGWGLAAGALAPFQLGVCGPIAPLQGVSGGLCSAQKAVSGFL